MNRRHASWSNFTDVIEGPCVVCGKDVQFVLPADRPSPSILYHITCDAMGKIRENVKKASPSPLAPSETIRWKNGKPAEPPAPPAAPKSPPPTVPGTPA